MLRKFRIRLNEKEYIVEMEELTPGVGFEAPIQTTAPVQTAPMQAAPVEPVKEDKKLEELAEQSAQVGSGQEVKSPMPGTVVGIKKKVGDLVKEDEVVVVFEAMKMENEIVSPKDGKITSIPVTEGKALDVNEVLFTVE